MEPCSALRYLAAEFSTGDSLDGRIDSRGFDEASSPVPEKDYSLPPSMPPRTRIPF